MPLGIVSELEFEKEINIILPDKEPLPVQEVEIKDIEHGRGIGKLETPQLVREFIAVESNLGTSSKELQEMLGLSGSSISAYANGAHSTSSYNEPDDKIKRAVENAKVGIAGRAQQKLIDAIDKIDLSGVIKPNVASTIAKDMSSIVRNMGPELGVTVNNKVVVFRPRTREEDAFEVIEVQ